MADRLGSTSWPNRHKPYFGRLNELLQKRSGRQVIAIVGPGAVTRLCRPLLTDAARQASRLRRWIGDGARYSDQLLRRIPGIPLVCLEAEEVEEAIGVEHDLLVADHSERVLGAVQRQLPSSRCFQIDLSAAPLPFHADVIIAFNVLSRIADGAKAIQNLLAGLKEDGLLLMDSRSAARLLPREEFEEISPKTHARKAATRAGKIS